MDYLIDNNVIALLKNDKQTIIYNVNNLVVFNKNFKKVINDNCLLNGSSFEGRKKYVKNVLNIKYKLPILINEKQPLIFIPTGSIRNKECLFINIDKIVDYKWKENTLKIECYNNYYFKLKISISSFEKLILNAVILKNKLKLKN